VPVAGERQQGADGVFAATGDHGGACA